MWLSYVHYIHTHHRSNIRIAANGIEVSIRRLIVFISSHSRRLSNVSRGLADLEQ